MDGGSTTQPVEVGAAALLVERARQGDRDAFNGIVADRIEATFREVSAILGDEERAQETTRQVFLRAWRDLPRLRDPARFPAWFGRIVVDGCLAVDPAAGRGRGRRLRGLGRPVSGPARPDTGGRGPVREIQVSPAVEDVGPVAPSTANRPRGWEDPDLIARTLGSLPVRTRIVLYLHYHERLSLQATGERLSISARTVWSRLYDARRALERALRAELSADPGERLTDEAILVGFERRASRPLPRGLRLELAADISSIGQVPGWRRHSDRLLPTAWRLALIGMPAMGAVLLVALAVGQIAPQAKPSPLPAPPNGLLAFLRGGDVYLVNPDGSDARVVLHADGVPFRTVTWSPDGRQLAVGSDEAVFVLGPASLGARRVATGQLAAWSPDSRQIAVIDPAAEAADGSNTIRIVRVVDGTAIREIPTPAQSNVQVPLAWSPDGRWLAGQGGLRLVRFDVQTGLMAEIAAVETRYPSAGPAWSPDGRRIAYTTWDAPDDGSCRRSCTGTLTLVDADGGNPTRPVSKPSSQSQPAWSPDGQSIAFLDGAGSYADGGLWVVDLATRATKQQSDGPIGAFGWGADGTSLGFERRTDTDQGSTWTLARVSTDRRGEVELVPTTPDLGFAWQASAGDAEPPPFQASNAATPEPVSPEPWVSPAPASLAQPGRSDSSLVFDMTAEDATAGSCVKAVRTSPIDGKTTVVRSFCGLNLNYGQWSPDGSAYAAITDDHLDLTRPDGTTRQFIGGWTSVDTFSWSPGGQWLAVHRCPTPPVCLWSTIKSDGTQAEDLLGEPTWSSDGRYRLIRMPDGTSLFTDLERTLSTALSNPLPAGASLSNDGARAAYVKDGDVWVEAVPDGEARKVTAFDFGGASSPVWSPDGQSLAVVRSGELWIVPVDGGSPRRVGFERDSGFGLARWSPDGSRIAIDVWSQSGSARTAIVAIDGSPTVVLELAQTPTWSPDGRYLAVASVDPTGSVSQLDIVNADGTGRTAVWSGQGNNLPQAWAP